MSSDWPEYSIDEIKSSAPSSIAIGPFGSRMKADCYVDAGVYVIRGTNLTLGREFSGDFVFITAEKAQELGGANLRPNDLVFPHRGAIGEVGVVPDDGNHYVLSSSLMKLQCDERKANPWFVYYFFKSAKGRSELLKNTSQVGTPGIGQPLTSLKAIRLRLPSAEEQQQIVEILAALDDRITLLRQTNKTLESIAQAIFKSWFVDFDPVRAKMEGRQPEGMDEETAALFPDSFEESDLGLIPKGWATAPFYDTIQIIGGGTPKTSNPDYWGGSIPWYSVVDAPTETDVFVIDTEKKITKTGLEGSSTKLLPQGTTIISARGTVGKLALTGCEMTMNQSCYGLRGLHNEKYFTYFSTKRLVDRLKQQAHGSVFDTITQATFKSIITVRPPVQTMLHYEKSVDNIMARILTNLVSTSVLAELRDTLLPRLISGQLRLSEAQEQVEDVLS